MNSHQNPDLAVHPSAIPMEGLLGESATTLEKNVIEWQYKSVWKCDRHQLKLLAKCPNCEAPFKIPELWEDGCCHRCRMPFTEMAKLQN